MVGRQVVYAPCKINLHLGIHAQTDERGYHYVDSVMAPVGLFDEVTVDDAPFFAVRHEPALEVPPEKTTVWKAATMLAEEPPASRLFRDHARAYGLTLTDLSARLGSPELCRAAAEAAAMNVFVNTGLLAPDDRAATEARAEYLRATVVQSCAQTADAVFAALRGEG